MGTGQSRLEKALGSSASDAERFFGFDNFGNTCYCNSVLQALYFCKPFRQRLLEYYTEYVGPIPPINGITSKSTVSKGSLSLSLTLSLSLARVALLAHLFSLSHSHTLTLALSLFSHHILSMDWLGEVTPLPEESENLLTCLGELFATVATQRKKSGSLAPRKFIQRLKRENELFRGYMQQDAHEFFNYLLNEISDISRKQMNSRSPQKQKTPATEQQQQQQQQQTLVQEIFQGVMTNETRCLCCENVTSREETFLDLSVDVEQNYSLTACLRNFSNVEVLKGQDKFYCDNCCSLQEAERRMKVKRLPPVLALHLKRFKYIEQLQRHKKLAYRVAFPFELKLPNMSDEAVAEEGESEYELFAVVIHIGSGPNHGHYVSMVKSNQHWLLFDDHLVDVIDESVVRSVFGFPSDFVGISETGYILFYQAKPTNAVQQAAAAQSQSQPVPVATSKSSAMKIGFSRTPSPAASPSRHQQSKSSLVSRFTAATAADRTVNVPNGN